MTHEPTMPGFPPSPPPLPPSTPKKSRTNAIIIGSAVAVIAAIVATGVVVVQTTGDDSKQAAASASSSPAEDVEPAAEEPEPEPEPTYSEPTVDDFTMELRTTRRKCFGSAGCNITVEPELSYVGFSEDLDPDAVYEITYEIRGGGDDGPVIETAELSEQTTLNFTPSLLTGVSASAKLSVEITDVMVQGY